MILYCTSWYVCCANRVKRYTSSLLCPHTVRSLYTSPVFRESLRIRYSQSTVHVYDVRCGYFIVFSTADGSATVGSFCTFNPSLCLLLSPYSSHLNYTAQVLHRSLKYLTTKARYILLYLKVILLCTSSRLLYIRIQFDSVVRQ